MNTRTINLSGTPKWTKSSDRIGQIFLSPVTWAICIRFQPVKSPQPNPARPASVPLVDNRFPHTTTGESHVSTQRDSQMG